MTERPRIVDVVFAPRGGALPRMLVAGIVVALAAHGALVLWATLGGGSLESWSADLARELHAEIGRVDSVDVDKPDPPKPDEPPPEPGPNDDQPLADDDPAPRAMAPSPAQAGRIIAAEPGTAADFTGAPFVTGTADAYAGNVTSTHGTSKTAVSAVSTGPPPKPRAPKPKRRPLPKLADLSRQALPAGGEWTCPWPREADEEQIDRQTAVVRVLVSSDGRPLSARVVADPGHGFGVAARRCAMASTFQPALDRDGDPVKAESPPIRVHFTR